MKKDTKTRVDDVKYSVLAIGNSLHKTIEKMKPISYLCGSNDDLANNISDFTDLLIECEDSLGKAEAIMREKIDPNVGVENENIMKPYPWCFSPEKDNPYPLCIGGKTECKDCCRYADYTDYHSPYEE